MNIDSLRPQLFDIAYRMLGSTADAEELVQDSFARWHATPHDDVQSPQAWLSTIVTRLSLDRLKSASVKREQYVGPWLPEPLLTTDENAETTTLRSERISLAFLVVLEQLSPLERAVFLLHEVFDYGHLEIAGIIERTPEACRKLLERAKKQMEERKPRFAPTRDAHRKLVEAFARAVAAGDASALTAMLDPNVRSDADGGGKATAARRPVLGRENVVRLFASLARFNTPDVTWGLVELNGWPAMVFRLGGRAFAAIHLETDGEHVHAIRATLNPDKLTRL